MANPLKKLAGQTAIYGTSSIVGRMLNYFLVPLHTNVFDPDQFGIVNELYAYVAFLIVVLTYGMETAFFRYSEKFSDKNRVYATTLLPILSTSLIFVVLAILFSTDVATMLRYPQNNEYVVWFALIISLDAISSIPFARLRAQNRPMRFASIKLVNISVNIGLNLFFLLLCPYLMKFEAAQPLVSLFYRGSIGVGYIFIANLIASAVTALMLVPEMVGLNYRFDKGLFKQMLKYALPLLIFSLAGIVNEVIDRVLLKYLLPKETSMVYVGIYGACYKISIMMSIFIQAFRYAAEPFFFSQAKEHNAKQVYADLMKYFVMVLSLLFLGIMLYLDVVKYFVGEKYHSGLKVVPVLLMANLFLGVFYNLSIWYKLTNKTIYGAYISIIGALITLGLNFWLIPLINYMGSAWATFACYFSMMTISYFVGQKHYPVNYPLKKLAGYFFMALGLYYLSTFNPYEQLLPKLLLNSLLLSVYLGVVLFQERSLLVKR